MTRTVDEVVRALHDYGCACRSRTCSHSSDLERAVHAGVELAAEVADRLRLQMDDRQPSARADMAMLVSAIRALLNPTTKEKKP